MLISSYEQVFNPFYFIQIGNDQLRKGRKGGELGAIPPKDVISFQFEDHAKKADELKLLVRDDDLSKLDSGIYVHDNFIQFTFGQIGGVISPPRVMMIKGVNPTFPEDGLPTLEIIAYDQGVSLATKFRSVNWGKRPSAGIALEIALKNDLFWEIDDSDDLPKQDVLQSPTLSDMQFLVKLAKRINFLVYIENNTLYYKKKPTADKPIATFTYRNPDGQQNTNTVLSFRPKTNTVKPAAETSGDGQNKTKATAEKSKEQGLGKFLLINNISGEVREETKPAAQGVRHTPSPGDQKRIENSAQSKLDENLIKSIAGTLRCIGNAGVSGKSVIHLHGCGKKYFGNYFVESVRHTINESGYFMDLEINREGLAGGSPNSTSPKKENKTEENKQKFITLSNITGEQVK